MSGRAAVADVLGDASYLLAPVGSRVTCSPPPVGADEDWLCLCNPKASERLQAAGFEQDGSPEFYTGNDNGGFRSYRRGDLNVIITQDSDFFERFTTASELARRFNLLRKCDRIALFQAVLYGVRADHLELEEIA
jgi:hypothetical protein